MRFTGDYDERRSVSRSVRTNLPEPVEAGVEYEDVRVDYTLAAEPGRPAVTGHDGRDVRDGDDGDDGDDEGEGGPSESEGHASREDADEDREDDEAYEDG